MEFAFRPGEAYLLRMGHRRERDRRVTTHCALAAMALGASGAVISGEEDPGLISRLTSASARWRPGFWASYSRDWRTPLRAAKSAGLLVVHLTMYGVGLPFVADGLRLALRRRGLLAVVGAEKVPPEVYREADLNVAVTHYPHSEVAALAIMFWEVLGPSPAGEAGELEVLPSHRGKLALRAGEHGGGLGP